MLPNPWKTGGPVVTLSAQSRVHTRTSIVAFTKNGFTLKSKELIIKQRLFLRFPFSVILSITMNSLWLQTLLHYTDWNSHWQRHDVSGCDNFIRQHDMTWCVMTHFVRQVNGMHANSTCTVYAWAGTWAATWMPLNTHIWCCMLIC